MYAVAVVGVNTTFTVHEAPAAKVAPQFPPARENGVATLNVNVPPVKSTLPILVTVRVIALLVVPIAQLANANGLGLTEARDIAATVFALIVTGELVTPVIVTDPSGRLPSLRTTTGAEVYPLPPLTTLIALTTPPVMTAVAEAPIPPPPIKRTVGGDVYKLPPLVTLIALTLPPVTTAVALEVGVEGTLVHWTVIVHDAPAARVVPQVPPFRANGPVKLGTGMVNVVVPLLDNVKSRVAVAAALLLPPERAGVVGLMVIAPSNPLVRLTVTVVVFSAAPVPTGAVMVIEAPEDVAV